MKVKSHEKTFLIVFIVAVLLNGLMAKKSTKKMAFNFMAQLKNCDDGAEYKIYTVGLDPVRYNASVVYLDGKFHLKENIDNLFVINIEIIKILPSGGNEIVVTYEMNDFCLELDRAKTSKTFFTPIANSLNIPNKCPVPSGTYTVKKLILEPTLLQSLREGEYNIKLEFTKHDVKHLGLKTNTKPSLFGCVSFPVVVEPAE